MTDPKIPAPPASPGASGARLWSDVLSKYELEEHEMALLREAVRSVDLLDDLAEIIRTEGLTITGPHGSKIHPAVVEARQLGIALARVLAALRLPAGEEDDPAAGRRPQRRSGVRGIYGIGEAS